MMKRQAGVFWGFLTVLCWSAYNVAAKHGIDTGLSPQALAFLRFAVPGIVVLPVVMVLFMRGRLRGIPFHRLLILILLGGPVFGLIAVSGYVFAPLSHGLLFAPVAVFLTGIVLGHVLLQEAVTIHRLKAAALMFAGLAVLVGFDLDGLGATWGQGAALFVLAGMLWGAYTVLLRLWQIPMVEGTLTVASGSALFAVPVLGVAAYPTLSAASPSTVVLQIVMQGGVGGIVSVVALIGAVRSLPVHVAALLPVFTPVTALGIAGFVFGTLPNLAEALGVLIIAVGFVISAGVLPHKTWSRRELAPHRV